MGQLIDLYGLADRLLTVAWDATNAVLPADYHHDRVHVVNGPPSFDGWDEAGCVEHLVSWVEMVTPTGLDFPLPPPGPIDCVPPGLAAQVVIQWLRCEPTVTADGFPDPAALELAARLVLTEARIVWDAISCWATRPTPADPGTDPDGAGDLDVMLAGMQPVPPQGGVAGMELRVTVGLEPCGPCVPVAPPNGWLP